MSSDPKGAPKPRTEDVPRSRKHEYLMAAMQILASNEEPMSPRDVFSAMRSRLRPSGIELEHYPTEPGIPRFETITRWMTIRAVKAGWMVKRDGLWEITPDGAQALTKQPDSAALGAAAVASYNAWRRAQTIVESIPEDDSGEEIPPDVALSSSALEVAKEKNKEALGAKIKTLSPYELQDMVAALLRAMGYHVAYVAKPGRDRGLDIIAYRDPLGTSEPRIKVQVKHSEQIGRPELEKFVGAIRTSDIGIYVSSGGFSGEAKTEARTHRTHDLTLIDMSELIKLWTSYYGALEESAKRFLPLEVVHFLAET